jgi:hypothetical protein
MKRAIEKAVAILIEATTEVVEKRFELLRALIFPVAGSTSVLLFGHRMGPPGLSQWLLVAAYFVFYALFAVSCHRIILLGKNSLPNEFGLYWTLRETRFAGWLFVIFVVYTALAFPFGLATLLLPQQVVVTQIPWYLWTFIMTYFEGRISMVLPAAAVEQRMNLPSSWYLTRGHGLAIAIALFIPALAIDMITLVVNRILFRDAPIAGEVIESILVYPLVAIAVGVISVTYRKVTLQE